MLQDMNWALVVPMANEEKDFTAFSKALVSAINHLPPCKVYFVVDSASTDNTLGRCQSLSQADSRFVTIWAPENKNVVDAYLRGYREAYNNGHEYIIEMDAGLSHDPASLPDFLKHLSAGVPCVFGSRFITGGSMHESSFKRKFISSGGTRVANLLLGTSQKDMTSGYQGFRREIVKKFLVYKLLSKAHFYQTEIRYLLRKYSYIEIPIRYRAPSPRISSKAILNALLVLGYYFFRRITFRAIAI